MILHRRQSHGPNELEHSGFPTRDTQKRKIIRSQKDTEQFQRHILHHLRNYACY